jgi:perosamine synthetase
MAELVVDSVLAALRTVLGTEPAALHEPCFSGNEWRYVKDCLDTGWVSSAGAYVERFERDLAEFTGARHAIAVVNGTAALHVCLQLAGVRHGDEVLVPTLTFVATANAVAYLGATPHFSDSAEDTLGLDPVKLGQYLDEVAILKSEGCFNRISGARIAAVVPMHALGHPVDIDPLVELCHKWRLALVEDAAESLGSYYKGRHTGTLGRLGALSFNGNKVITTGGGGAILTDDETLAKRAKHLTTTARIAHRWSFVHDEVGYNYRLPNINAALGCAQIEQLEGFVTRKRALAQRYAEAFAGVASVRFFVEQPRARSNYWLNALLLDEAYAGSRDALLAATNEAGAMTRPAWMLMHKLPMFRDCPRMDLAVAESLERRLVNLPSSAFLLERGRA